MLSMQEYLKQPRLAKFPFLFVVSYGRSGSTLLVGLLNSLRNYHIRGENNGALFPVYRAVELVRLARYRRGLQEATANHPWYGAHLMVPELFAQGCVDAFFQSVLRVPLGARCCGFKEIRYTDVEMSDGDFVNYLDFLAAYFPGAAFVFNVRDVEATAGSGWWQDQDREIVLQRLTKVRQRMFAYAPTRPGNSYLFDYDALRQDHTYFAGLCEFLGEEFDQAAVRTVISVPHATPLPNTSQSGNPPR